MQELNPKQILKTIEQIEALAEKLDDLLPNHIIMEAEPRGIDSLLSIRRIAIDVFFALKLASGAILHIKQMLDEQEAT